MQKVCPRSFFNSFGMLTAIVALSCASITLGPSAEAQVSVPNTFRPGTTIRSQEVNENFDTLESAINSIADISQATNQNPVTIDVDCTGTGSTLKNVLDNLNPVAAPYDIKLTGNCSETVAISNFSSLLIRSKDPANPATIKGINNISGFNIRVQNVNFLFDANEDSSFAGGCAICSYSPGRLDVVNADVKCVAGSCQGVVIATQGEVRLYSVTKSGTWSASGARVTAQRQGSILAAWSGDNPRVCYAGDEYRARWGGVILYAPDSWTIDNCPSPRKDEQDGGGIYGF
jgi:hypothetical protein